MSSPELPRPRRGAYGGAERYQGAVGLADAGGKLLLAILEIAALVGVRVADLAAAVDRYDVGGAIALPDYPGGGGEIVFQLGNMGAVAPVGAGLDGNYVAGVVFGEFQIYFRDPGFLPVMHDFGHIYRRSLKEIAKQRFLLRTKIRVQQ